MTEKFGTPMAVQGPAPHDSLRALCEQIKAKNEQWRSLFDADMAQLAAELLGRVDEIVELTRAPDLAAEVEQLRADLDAERRKVEALEKAAALAVGRTAARCREMALWPQGIDDEQAFYGRMFAEFIDKEFGAQIRAALAASDPQKGGA